MTTSEAGDRQAIEAIERDLLSALEHAPLCSVGRCVCRVAERRKAIRLLVQVAAQSATIARQLVELRATVADLKLRLDSTCRCNMTCDECDRCDGSRCPCDDSCAHTVEGVCSICGAHVFVNGADRADR